MPPPEVISAMPHHEQVVGALADYDLVGFQTETDTANFARYIAAAVRHALRIWARSRGGLRPRHLSRWASKPRDFIRMAQEGRCNPMIARLVEQRAAIW